MFFPREAEEHIQHVFAAIFKVLPHTLWGRLGPAQTAHSCEASGRVPGLSAPWQGLGLGGGGRRTLGLLGGTPGEQMESSRCHAACWDYWVGPC